MANSGTIRHVMADGSSVEEALQRAAVAARLEYVRAGLSMPVWRGGRLVWVEPTELKRYDADGYTKTLGQAAEIMPAPGKISSAGAGHLTVDSQNDE